jgi:hypothetical protein
MLKPQPNFDEALSREHAYRNRLHDQQEHGNDPNPRQNRHSDGIRLGFSRRT